MTHAICTVLVFIGTVYTTFRIAHALGRSDGIIKSIEHIEARTVTNFNRHATLDLIVAEEMHAVVIELEDMVHRISL